MSSAIFFDWVAIALSLFNAIILFWLGLTVLLNADRPNWSIWLAGASLIVGGIFFYTHTIILHRGLFFTEWRVALWWVLGLVPALLLPYAWYLVMLWYAGYWKGDESPLRHRHRPWLYLLTAVMSVGLLILLATILFSSPIAIRNAVYDRFPQPTPPWGVPLSNMLLLGAGGGYGVYLMACFLLAINAITHPGPTKRFMGNIARNRAWPWLLAATFLLLFVSTLVLTIFGWVWYATRLEQLPVRQLISLIFSFDLAILVLVTLAVLCMGQAAVAYEIFTGQVLPRRGLRQQWYLTLAIGLVFSLVVSAAIILNLPPVFSLLLMSILVTCLAAMLGWHSYKLREQAIHALRPFVTSQHLYELLIAPNRPTSLNLHQPLADLCQHILGATLAYLIPIRRLAPLNSTPLSYPVGQPAPTIQGLLALFPTPTAASQPLDPTQYNGAIWAIPLWHERGLIGLFLLGPKQNEAPYTQEEVEIGRATGERLLDIQASAEMTHLLVKLQRQQMVQSQLLDQQTRRVVHDEVLPQLHTATLSISQDPVGNQQGVIDSLTAVHRQLSKLLREIPHPPHPTIARHGVLAALRQLVTEEMIAAFDEVVWEIDPSADEQVGQLPDLAAEILFYAAREAIRNAAKHGRLPPRPLQLTLRATWAAGLELQIEDNGRGLDLSNGRANPSTGGQGLALHSTMLAIIGGQLHTESALEQFTRVRLFVPENE